MKTTLTRQPTSTETAEIAPQPRSSAHYTAIALATGAFLLCIALSIAPLARLGGSNFFLQLPISTLLPGLGSWLPTDLHLDSDLQASQISSQVLLFLGLMALAFSIYGACAWYIQRRAVQPYSILLRWIWLGAIAGGILYVLTPALLSRDAFVYAGYGRVLAIHHANPYFVTLSNFSTDLFNRLDDWHDAPAAYGPFWLLISAVGALISGDHPLSYLLLYRLLGLLAHLCNIALIMAILRTQGRPERTVALAALLYGWNPLALEESSLGGHNDVVMVTLLLLGCWLWVRVEQRGNVRLRPGDYLPPLAAFTLAALIKFTSVPLIMFFLVLLARKALLSDPSTTFSTTTTRGSTTARVVATLLIAGSMSAVIVLGLYGPFWIGQSIPAILSSFLTPPSANTAYGSILSALQYWVAAYGLPSQEWLRSLLVFFTQQQTWTAINLATLAGTMLAGTIWIWRAPKLQTLVLAALGTLGALLIVTTWFFPWYVLWLLGLGALCIPTHGERVRRVLIGFALTFSVSAFAIYLFYHNLPPIGGWIGLTCLATTLPPLLSVVVLATLPTKHKRVSLISSSKHAGS